MDRFAYRNLVAAVEGALIIPSASQPGFTSRNLRDPLRSVEWRSPVGHTIGRFNDRLDFERSSVPYAAVLTHGTYATPDDLAEHVEARMNAEDANSYNIVPNTTSGQSKFQITGSAAFELRFATGANLARSIALDLGHSEIDKTGANNYASNVDAYHSRAWIVVDLLTAQAFQRALILGHNLTPGASVVLEANDSDAWTTPAAALSLPVAGIYRGADFAEATWRYVRLELDDRSNPDAFTRIGAFFVGPYFEPSRGHSLAERHGRTGASRAVRARQGALHQVRYQQGGEWGITFEGLTDADRASFEVLADDVRAGGSFFWTHDAADLSDTHYLTFVDFAFERLEETDDKWILALDLEEALG